MPIGFWKKYYLFILVVVGGGAFGLVQYNLFQPTQEIEILSVISEGFVTCVALYGLYIIQSLQHYRDEYVPLMTGFTALFIALLTDTLDEVVEHPDIITFFFEDVFQMVGYAFIILGLRQWVLHNVKQDGE